MKILIIEDEIPAVNRLKSLIAQFDSSYEIIDEIDSVKSAISWFSLKKEVDLIFMDIQLGDGLSFEIFEYCDINVPIVFTTAFDQYAIQAFKVNSIDYLLKPFDKNDLENAFSKLSKLKNVTDNRFKFEETALKAVINSLSNQYKTRFIIKVGERLHSIHIDETSYFYSQEKVTFLQTCKNNLYIIDYSLDQLTDKLDPTSFFRINRKYIIHIDSIQSIVSFSNSRLKLQLQNCDDKEIIVSREKVNGFKQWLDR